MPSMNQSKQRPPAAPKRKRVLHAFYLAQPFLQFFALMAVLFVLGRCSPLSPSSEKSRLKSVSENGVISTPSSETAEVTALEKAIKEASQKIGVAEHMPVVSLTDFTNEVRESLHPLKLADQARVKHIFQKRGGEAQRETRILQISLTAEERARLVQGSLQIDLAERLKPGMNAETQKLFFSLLRKHQKGVQGKIVLVISDKDMELAPATSIPLGTKLQLSVLPSEEKAYLTAERIERVLDDEQQEAISSNLERAVNLAVVLE